MVKTKATFQNTLGEFWVTTIEKNLKEKQHYPY